MCWGIEENSEQRSHRYGHKQGTQDDGHTGMDLNFGSATYFHHRQPKSEPQFCLILFYFLLLLLFVLFYILNQQNNLARPIL